MNDHVVQLVTVFILIMVIFTYGRFNSLEQAIVKGNIETVSMNVQKINSLLGFLDERFERYARQVTELEQRLAISEEQKKHLLTRIDSLVTEMDVVRAAAAQTAEVQLGAIAVSKSGR